MAIIFNIGESVKLSAFNILQEPIKMLLESEREAFEKESMINKVYVMKTMDKYQEEYRSSTAFDGFRPTEDLEIPNISSFSESYRKTFRTHIWTNSFVISKQTIEDNQMMDVSTRAIGFIRSYGRTREEYAFGMLGGALTGEFEFYGHKFDCKGADTTDGTVEGPKQLYFHNAHKTVGVPGYAEIEQSNKFHAGMTDGGPVTAPEYLLSVIGQVQTEMINYVDDKGNILLVNPDTILIPNHYAFRDMLLTALKSQFTSSMGTNGYNMQYGNWNILVSPYLNKQPGFKAEDMAFIMIDSKYNREALGAVWFDRTPLEVTSYTDNGTKANIWDGRARFGAGFNNFRCMAYVSCGGNQATATAKSNATAIKADDVAGLLVTARNTTTVDGVVTTKAQA